MLEELEQKNWILVTSILLLTTLGSRHSGLYERKLFKQWGFISFPCLFPQNACRKER